MMKKWMNNLRPRRRKIAITTTCHTVHHSDQELNKYHNMAQNMYLINKKIYSVCSHGCLGLYCNT
jgi:hypothetical protein